MAFEEMIFLDYLKQLTIAKDNYQFAVIKNNIMKNKAIFNDKMYNELINQHSLHYETFEAEIFKNNLKN